MRCNHLNGQLIELITIVSSHNVERGIVDATGWHSDGSASGYEYRCEDCNRSWRSKSLNGFKPKWLNAIAEQLLSQ